MGKGKLFGLLAVFAAIGLVTASGAFTTVSAERTASVNVAGDSSALLALEPTGPNENGGGNGPDGYAQIDGDGQLEINLAGYGSGADGVNPNAQTNVSSVFRITNQGTQTVSVTITENGTNTDAVTFYNSSKSGNLESGGVDIDPGESVIVSIGVDTTGISADQTLIDSINITAEATN